MKYPDKLTREDLTIGDEFKVIQNISMKGSRVKVKTILLREKSDWHDFESAEGYGYRWVLNEQVKPIYLKKYDGFIPTLDNKWCIKLTKENTSIVKEYVENLDKYKSNGSFGFFENQYIYFPEVSWNMRYSSDYYNPSFYPEITFEDFKKYILKENTMQKELIGYRLNGKATAEEVAKLLNCSSCEIDGLFFSKHNLNSSTVKRAKDLGILDLWFEAVYKEIKEFKYFHLSNDNYSLCIHKNGKIACRDGEFEVSQLQTQFRPYLTKEKFQTSFIHKNGKWNIYFNAGHIAFGLGCNSATVEVTLQELKNIISIWEELNK